MEEVTDPTLLAQLNSSGQNPSTMDFIQMLADKAPDPEAVARGAMQGSTFGFADEAQGALGALGARAFYPELFQDQSFGDLYKRARDYTRAQNDTSQQASPGSYLTGQLGGAVAAIPAAAEAIPGASTLLSPSSSMLGRLAQAGGIGGLFGYGNSNANDASGQLWDTGVGAVTGLGAGVAGELASPILNRLAAKYGTSAITDAGTDAGTGASNAAPESVVTQDTAPAIQAYQDQGLTPEQAMRKAQGERFGVPMTAGDITQNAKTQGMEDLSLKGAFGEGNEHTMQLGLQNQKAALDNMATKIATDIGGGQSPITDMAQVAGNVQAKLRALNEQGQQAVDEAYKVAESKGTAAIPVTAFKAPMTDAVNVLKNQYGIDPALTPATSKAVDKIQNFFDSNPDNGVLPYKAADNFRKVLNNYYNAAANPTDRAGISILKNQLNTITDNAVENGLVSGNPEAITELKKATGVAADYFKRFDDNKIVQTIIDKDMQPETVAKMIFGMGQIGGNTEAATTVNKLKDLLGADSPEFQQIKQAGVGKLFYNNIPGSIHSNPDVVKGIAGQYASNVDKFINTNKSLANALYTPEEQQTLLDSAKYVAKPIATRQPGTVNTSNTTPVLARLLGHVEEVPLVGKMLAERGKEAVIGSALKGQIAGNVGASPSNPLVNALKQKFAPTAASLGIGQIQAPDPQEVTDPEILKQLNGAPEEPQALPPIPVSQAQPVEAPPSPNENKVLSSIDNAAKQTGVPTNLLHTIAAAESNLNPQAKNPNSSAKGLFQMTQSTWKQMVNKYGDQFGIKYKDINDPQANATMAAMLTKDNAARMENKIGRQPSTGEIYLAHFLGVPGAIKLMTANPDAKAASLFPAAAQANRSVFFNGSNSKTAAEVYHDITDKITNISASTAVKPTAIQTAALSAIPKEAQQALLSHPHMAKDFDAMYGNGLASLVIGGSNVR